VSSQRVLLACDVDLQSRRTFLTLLPSPSAVTGLPVARSDHAAVMALFATEISRRFANMSKFLEIVLGPGTARLALRVGIHSGPVIAGVLRSDKARFQLFGDVRNKRRERDGVLKKDA
jgi:Adenylate and Guanylate cyclase catalytic domain